VINDGSAIMNLPFYKVNRVYLYLLFILSGLLIAPVKTFATNYYQQDFEADLGGFVLDNAIGLGHGLWHRTDKAIASQPGHSLPYILYYGLDDPCDYNLIDPIRGPMAHQGRAISPVIDLTTASAPLFLEFRYYLETENDPNYDRAAWEISADGGPFELLAGQRAGLIDPSGRWQKCVINLSNWAGCSIKLRFGLNTVDDYANDFTGFAVDDLLIHDGSEPVHFENAILESAVETELGISNPTAADMTNLMTLRKPYRSINSLVGLEYALNLQELSIYTNSISDISPLAGLTSLGDLNLYNNQISDFSPLAGLTNLWRLLLSSNQTNDLSHLAALTNLQELFLNFNQISDLSPLVGLTKLQRLYLHSNQISDLSPLAEMTNLYELDLDFNQISDLSPLADMTNMQTLDLHSNNISDLSPLAAMTKLQMLYLSYNQISQLTPLANLTYLQELYLYNNEINDLAPLAGLINLYWLSLNENQIGDLAPLSDLNNLQWLSVSYNQISDLFPLADLINLRRLSLDHNQVSNISPLAAMNNLYELRLGHNQIIELEPLADLTHLQVLYLRFNPLNTPAYCHWIPIIQANNPGIKIIQEYNSNILTDDCSITLTEYAVFANQWLARTCTAENSWCYYADLDHDGTVNLVDFAILAGLWLR